MIKIGLTYDLRDDYLKMGFSEQETAEFDKAETVQAIEDEIHTMGYISERIGNIYELTKQISQGKTWDLIFNIAEGLYGNVRESQIPALLDAFRINYTYSDALTNALTLNKEITKKLLKFHNIRTPDFFTIDNSGEALKSGIVFPVFVKPAGEGTSKGITSNSLVNSKDELKMQLDYCKTLTDNNIIIEEYLPGNEYTVGIIGTGTKAKVIGILEINISDPKYRGIYSYEAKENCETEVKYTIHSPESLPGISQVALETYRILNCRDAGRIDIKMDKNGLPNVIELNTLPGMHPQHSDLPMISNFSGFGYDNLVRGIVKSALERSVSHILSF